MAKSSPAVTFMVKFVKAYPQYLNYTKREKAVLNELENDNLKYQFSEENESMAKKLSQSLNVKETDFKKYVNYTNRSTAITRNGHDTGTFNDVSYNLNEEEITNLKSNLQLAQKNKSLLWQGVISFDMDFLKQSNILDSKTGYLNHLEIKRSVQDAMKNIIAREELKDAFWWGNIHNDTQHVHVHVGLSERQNSRRTVSYENSVEPKGTFSRKTIRSVKSTVYNTLTEERTRNRRIKIEKKIDFYKNKLVTDIKDSVSNRDAKSENLLQLLYDNLPVDTSKWRSKSNSKEMKLAKSYLKMYVDHFLNSYSQEDFKNFKNETKELLYNYHNVYSTKDQAEMIEKRTDRRVNEMKHRLSNDVLRYIKNNESSMKERSNLNFKKIDMLDTNSLKQLDSLYDNMSNSLNQSQKRQLKLIKYCLSQRSIDKKIATYINKIDTLNHYNPIDEDKHVIEMKIDEYKYEISNLLIRKKPKFKLSKSELTHKNKKISFDIDSLRKKSIHDFDSDTYDKYIHYLKKDLSLINSVSDQNLLKDMAFEGSNYKLEIKEKINIVETKYQINRNNIKISESKDPAYKQSLKKDNAKLFASLSKSTSRTEIKSSSEKINFNQLSRYSLDELNEISEIYQSYKSFLSDNQIQQLKMIEYTKKIKHVDNQIQDYISSLDRLNNEWNLESLDLVNLKKDEYKNEINNLILQKTPDFKLSSEQKLLKSKGYSYSADFLNKTPIGLFDYDLAQYFKKYFENERNIAEKIDKNDRIFKYVSENNISKTEYLSNLEKKIRIVDVKYRVNLNNQKLKNPSMSNEHRKKIRKENAELLQSISSKKNQEINDSDKINQTITKQNKKYTISDFSKLSLSDLESIIKHYNQQEHKQQDSDTINSQNIKSIHYMIYIKTIDKEIADLDTKISLLQAKFADSSINDLSSFKSQEYLRKKRYLQLKKIPKKNLTEKQVFQKENYQSVEMEDLKRIPFRSMSKQMFDYLSNHVNDEEKLLKKVKNDEDFYKAFNVDKETYEFNLQSKKELINIKYNIGENLREIDQGSDRKAELKKENQELFNRLGRMTNSNGKNYVKRKSNKIFNHNKNSDHRRNKKVDRGFISQLSSALKTSMNTHKSAIYNKIQYDRDMERQEQREEKRERGIFE